MALSTYHAYGIQIGFSDSLERSLTRTVNGLNLMADEETVIQGGTTGYTAETGLTQIQNLYAIGQELQVTGNRTLIRKTQFT